MRSQGVRTALAGAALLLLTACGGHDMTAAESGSTTHDMARMPGMGASAPPGSMPGMSMPGVVMDDGDGLSATKDGYTLTALKAPKVAGKPGTLSFTIDGPARAAHKEYVLSQTKLLHLYIVRKDLTDYQHVHPKLDATTGVWSVELTVPQPGPYHLLAEFTALQPNHSDLDARKLGADFTVGGTYTPAPFTPAFGPWAVDGYGVALGGQPKVGGADLKLKITKDGSGVATLQSYLDSFAHVTGFREGNLKAVHVHPNEHPTVAAPEGGPELTLSPVFAETGTYRLFVEFETLGTLHTVPIDIAVT